MGGMDTRDPLNGVFIRQINPAWLEFVESLEKEYEEFRQRVHNLHDDEAWRVGVTS